MDLYFTALLELHYEAKEEGGTVKYCIVKTQRNSTQLKTTLKQLALELDTVVTCSTTPPTHPPQTF